MPLISLISDTESRLIQGWEKTSRKAVLTAHRSQKITFCLSLCSSSVNVKIGGLCFLSWLDLGLLLTAASFTSCWPSPWPATRVRNQLNMHRCLVVYKIYQKNCAIDLQEESTRRHFCIYMFLQILAWSWHSKNRSSLFAFTCTCKDQLRPSITSFCACSCIWSFLSTEAALQAPRIVTSDWTLCSGHGQSDFFHIHIQISQILREVRE